jgi:Flp pilus assembly protein TadD
LPEVQLAWAKALNRVNDRVRAETAAETAVELAPTEPQYRSNLIAFQLAYGKSVDGLLTARAYLDLHPGPVADLLVAGTLILLKRDSEAEALLENSINANPDRNLALGLAGLEMKLGKAKRAVEVLSRSVAKNPDDFGLRREYASLLMETGDRTGAKREFKTLLKRRPEDSLVLNGLAVLIQEDDAPRALSLMSVAAKIAPRSAEILDGFGWMKFRRHDAAGALPLLQRAQTLKPTDPEVSYHYALALDATGKRDAAKTLLKAVLARNPGFNDASNAQHLLAGW